MTRATIPVAAENPAVRASLHATLVGCGIGDLVQASAEGSEGVVAVRDVAPAILVIATGPDEDAAEDVSGYREAAPDAHLIGFAFSRAEAFGRSGVDTVVRSDVGRAHFVEILRAIEA